MSNELAEVFSNESTAEAVSEAPEAASTETEVSEANQESESQEVEQTEETAQAEKTEENTKAEENESTETASEEKEYTANEKALFKQAKDERRKRQKLAERVEQLEAELAGKGEESIRPDVFEDQEGYTESLRNDFQTELQKQRLDIQREMMMEFKTDYLDVENAVIEEMQVNPVLKAELQKADNIAKAVYEYGKKLEQFNEAKGFDKEAYEAKLKAEIEEKVRKEYEEKAASESAASDNLSPSLANARGNSGKDVKGVETLADVFA